MKLRWITLASTALLLSAVLSVSAQQTLPVTTGPAPLRLLLVDATKTFSSTARVGALAGAIRATGAFDLQVCFSSQQDPYQDPMPDVVTKPDGTFDLVLYVPRGIDDESAKKIWIISNILPSTEGWPAVSLLSGLADTIFAGLARAVDVSEDLWPACLASLYRVQGWLL